MAENVPIINPEHAKAAESEREFKAEHTQQEQRLDRKERDDDKTIESIRQKIHETAARASEIQIDKPNKNEAKQPLYINHELRAEALRRSLNRIRKHLNKPQRAFSKAIHQPGVDALSKVGERTIARPTSLVIGSIVALAGSSYLFYSAKHYGYTYNYLSVILLFVGGYVAGLIIELLMYALHHRSK
jgi:hypothetical protein